MSRRAVAALALLVVAGSAPATAQRSAPPVARVEAKPLFMFNQSLYYGSLIRPRALAFDPKQKELWVADAGTNRLGVYRPDGVELFSFTSREHLRDVARIAIAPNGRVAVLEGKRDAIRLFNYRGEHAGDITLPQLGEKPVITALAFDAAGQLYVAESKSSQMFVFRTDGSLKHQFGSNGSDEGQFIGVCAITIGPDGNIYVLDQRAISVQVFDPQGNFIRGWGKHEMGAANFSLPSGIAVDSKGRVFVTDELRQQVKVFTPEGQLLVAFGGLGEGPGQLSFPTDVAVDDQDRVYVAERQTARVQVFTISVPAAAERSTNAAE